MGICDFLVIQRFGGIGVSPDDGRVIRDTRKKYLMVMQFTKEVAAVEFLLEP